MPSQVPAQDKGQSGWGYVLARIGTSIAQPGCIEVQSDGMEPGCGSAWGRGEWLQGLGESRAQAPASGLQHSPLDSYLLLHRNTRNPQPITGLSTTE